MDMRHKKNGSTESHYIRLAGRQNCNENEGDVCHGDVCHGSIKSPQVTDVFANKSTCTINVSKFSLRQQRRAESEALSVATSECRGLVIRELRISFMKTSKMRSLRPPNDFVQEH
jgi:hypothetical protein